MFGLVGPNGAGKTTVIKMLTTLLRPTSGRARVAGFDLIRQAAACDVLSGMCRRRFPWTARLRGMRICLIFAKLYDIPRRERESRLREALRFMGLSDSADKLVREYSGGMIRRLEIAQSTLHRPRVLFLDEPTVGLDPLARQAVWEHVEDLRDNYGTTIFLTTHYMEEADSLCSRVAIMHAGKVVAIGTPEELKNSIGGSGTTLDDVFVHYAGDSLESGGNFRETASERRMAKRLS